MGRPPAGGALRRMFPLWVALLTLPLSAACGGGELELPPPRPIIVTSGERLRVEPARMDSIYAWLTVQNETITEDPTFLVEGVPAARETMPWQTLTLATASELDTVRFQYDRAHPDITTPFNIYAHLHLTKQQGTLEEWLPGYGSAEGYELERAIVGRMADAWLLGRAVFDAPAYGPLDELIYAREAGFLDAYLLTARPNDFADARAAWQRDEPGEAEAYRTWFRRAFNREPPGLRETPGE